MRYPNVLLLGALAFAPVRVWACATCFGNPDSPQTQAANMAILFMLGVVGTVLGLLASFFVFLMLRARRIGRAQARQGAPRLLEERHAHE